MSSPISEHKVKEVQRSEYYCGTYGTRYQTVKEGEKKVFHSKTMIKAMNVMLLSTLASILSMIQCKREHTKLQHIQTTQFNAKHNLSLVVVHFHAPQVEQE